MRDQMKHEPEEQIDAWLLDQIAAATGPRDIGEMSDAELEKMLDICRDETYTPDQVERLLARFWIEVSPAPSTELDDERIGGDIATAPASSPDSQPSATSPHNLVEGPAFVEGPGEGFSLGSIANAATQKVVIQNTAIPNTTIPRVVILDKTVDNHHDSSSSPVLGFLGTAGRGTANFFSEYTPLLCLAGAVVFGLFLVWRMPMSGRAEVASSRPAAEVRSDFQTADVGRISGALDCLLADGVQPAQHQQLRVGQQLKLDRGLLEITYNAGARIVLQGPATYTVESAKGGFLSAGKLTATVEDDRRVANSKSKSKTSGPKFVLRTPSVTVNDLGTEFGVEVKPDTVTEVCVFRGKVETVTDSQAGVAPVRERLVAGEAIRFVSRDAAPQRTTVQSLGATPLPSPGEVSLVTRDARQSQLLTPAGLVATAYHRVWDAHGNLPTLGDRRQAFRIATDGIFGRGENAEGPRSSFDTLDARYTRTDFVGLTYGRRVRFDRIKIFLGHQFSDGGSWGKPPRVFVLVNPVDPGSIPPESDPANWHELPPPQVSYGKPFDAKADGNPGEVMEFVLTGQPAEYRTGYGWAIGGVMGNGMAGYVSITELRGYGDIASE